MTQIKKILDKQGNDIYLRTHTKAVVDDNGYTAESRLQAMQDEINQAQLAVGAVPSDLTPTEGSTNWVTSGGVFNKFLDIINRIKCKITYNTIWTDGKAVSSTTGNLVNNTNYSYSDFIDVSSYNYLFVDVLLSSSYYGTALYDSDKNFLFGVSGDGTGWAYKTQYINIQNAAYIRLLSPSKDSNYLNIGTPSIFIVDTLTNFSLYKENVYSIQNYIQSGQYKLSHIDYYRGTINTLGNIVDTSPYNSIFYYSDYIDVHGFDYVRTKLLTGSKVYGCTLYDSNKVLLEYYASSSSSQHGYTIPVNIALNGAYYIRIVAYQDSAYGEQEVVLYNKKTEKEPLELNPLFETVDTINNEVPNSIIKNVVFSSTVDNLGGALRRIPSVVITNTNTIIAATEVRSTLNDNAQTGIAVARKSISDDVFSYNLILPYNASSYGKVMNPCFVIDRNGLHGIEGRIFLFFLAFKITSNNNGFAYKCTTEEMDCMYIYSDDDGVTWSSPASIKTSWDTDKWTWVGVSPANGCQLTDGTLVLPCMGRYKNEWYSGVAYKTPSGNWLFSDRTHSAGDNESTCFDGIVANTIYLNCRNENDGTSRNLYLLDIETNILTKESYNYNPHLICQQSICKTIFSNKTIYFQSANDPMEYNTRNRLTLYISLDGIIWQRLIRINNDTTYGYSVVDSHNGKIVLVYENEGTITFVELSSISTLINDVYSQSLGKNTEDRTHVLLERFLN